MFILRSAFWLTAAFMVIGPTTGNDLGAMTQSAGTQIAEDGKALLADGLTAAQCTSLECELGRAVVIGALKASPSQSSINPVQDAPLTGPAPVPPPRPDWAS